MKKRFRNEQIIQIITERKLVNGRQMCAGSMGSAKARSINTNQTTAGWSRPLQRNPKSSDMRNLYTLSDFLPSLKFSHTVNIYDTASSRMKMQIILIHLDFCE